MNVDFHDPYGSQKSTAHKTDWSSSLSKSITDVFILSMKPALSRWVQCEFRTMTLNSNELCFEWLMGREGDPNFTISYLWSIKILKFAWETPCWATSYCTVSFFYSIHRHIYVLLYLICSLYMLISVWGSVIYSNNQTGPTLFFPQKVTNARLNV